jgi:hypothetical protein
MHEFILIIAYKFVHIQRCRPTSGGKPNLDPLLAATTSLVN